MPFTLGVVEPRFPGPPGLTRLKVAPVLRVIAPMVGFPPLPPALVENRELAPELKNVPPVPGLFADGAMVELALLKTNMPPANVRGELALSLTALLLGNA